MKEVVFAIRKFLRNQFSLEEDKADEALFTPANQKSDTVTLFLATFPRYLTVAEKLRLNNWLKERTNADSLRMVLQVGPTVNPEIRFILSDMLCT